VEKYTGTDMVYLAKGGSWLTFHQVISAISGFLLLIAFARFIPKDVYGTYKYILSFVGIISIFSFRGVSTAVIQAVSRGNEGSLFKGFKLKLFGGIFVFLVGGLISLYYYVNENNVLALSFVILAAALPFMNALYVYRALLSGRKKFNRLSQFEIITTVILFFTIFLTIYNTENVVYMIAAYFSAYIIVRFFLFFFTIKTEKPNNKEDSGTVRYAKHLSFMKAFGAIASQADKILIFHFLGAAPLAVFTVALAPVDQIRALLMNVRPLALPKLSVRTEEEIKKTLPLKIKKLEFVIVPIAVAYAISAPYIFKIFFPQYLEAVVLSQVLTIMLVFIPRSLITVAFTAKMKTKELYTLRIIGPIVRLVILFVLIYFYGMWGVVVGTILSEMFLYFLYHTLFRKM